MSFKLPKGFEVQKSDFYFGCDAYISVPIRCTFMNKDKNIVIGIYFGVPPSVEEVERMNSEAPLFHKKRAFYPDSNYIYGAKAKADTIRHKLIYLDYNYVKKSNNADRGAVYTRHCLAPNYLVVEGDSQRVVTDYQYKKNPSGKVIRTYNHNKVVTIAKTGRGHIEIDYLYTDKVSDKEMDNVVLTTSKMLQFNE